MKKKIIVVAIISFLILLIGCGNKDIKVITAENTNESKDKEETDMKLTIEYVCDKYDIDKSEFDGIDFNDFVEYYDLTYENIASENIPFLLNDYKSLTYKVKIPKYDSSITTDTFLTEYKEKIEVVRIVDIRADGSVEECVYTIVDFNIGLILVSSYPTSALSEDNIVGETDDDIKEKVKDSFEKYDVYNWKENVSSNNSEEDEIGTSNNISVVIELADGTVYGYSYSWSRDEEVVSNKNFFDFIDEIENLVY